MTFINEVCKRQNIDFDYKLAYTSYLSAMPNGTSKLNLVAKTLKLAFQSPPCFDDALMLAKIYMTCGRLINEKE